MRALLAAGCALSGALAAQAALLRSYSLYDQPVALGLGLALCGLVFIAASFALSMSDRDLAIERPALFVILALGLVARMAQFGAEGVLETDFHRYLLDGAASLAGVNPFAYSPSDVLAQNGAPLGLAPLSDDARSTLEQVNHPHLRTIYPGVTQIAFVFAAWIEPWSFDAWRAVLFAIDLGAACALIALLRRLDRSPLWAALYWLNPLVIKEVGNAGHFEPLLALAVFAFLLATLARRPILAAAALGMGAGVKVWPVLLMPLLLRHAGLDWRTAIAPIAAFGVIAMAAFAPALLAPIDGGSGVGAFAQGWANNAPIFDLLDQAVRSLAPDWGWAALRIALAATPAVAALWLAWGQPPGDDERLLRFAFALAIILVLANPVKLPWYMLWPLAFLPLFPRAPLILIAPAFSLYAAHHAGDPLQISQAAARSLVSWASAGVLWIVGLWTLWRLRHG